MIMILVKPVPKCLSLSLIGVRDYKTKPTCPASSLTPTPTSVPFGLSSSARAIAMNYSNNYFGFVRASDSSLLRSLSNPP